MSLWEKPGIPHKGWVCTGMIDLREDDPDAELETCEMCGKEGIRYVHMMEHPQYPQIVRTGRVCAENMERDYAAPGQRERELLNRHNRKMTFLKREWQQRQNGNFVLKFKGEYLTITPSKFNKNYYGVVYGGQSVWNYKNRKISDLQTAKLAAFDIFDALR
ncbi:hypothetical protein L9W92_18025 [Pelotomaculum terephthalicicum JT]|uniref:hypothetical protein n=1 Tax=Pelotomaculum terephthalicicum TaxID=206393 RepID=UPI001F04C098|nr:hypothetical protein [Pelotomaculum terephthalicicum]MCG9969898.1 hypothetical protein [Pelotomaculum terephthalicicum JT]